MADKKGRKTLFL